MPTPQSQPLPRLLPLRGSYISVQEAAAKEQPELHQRGVTMKWFAVASSQASSSRRLLAMLAWWPTDPSGPRSGPGKAKRLVGEGAAAALDDHARRVAAGTHALGDVLAAHLQGGPGVGRCEESGVRKGLSWSSWDAAVLGRVRQHARHSVSRADALAWRKQSEKRRASPAQGMQRQGRAGGRQAARQACSARGASRQRVPGGWRGRAPVSRGAQAGGCAGAPAARGSRPQRRRPRRWCPPACRRAPG